MERNSERLGEYIKIKRIDTLLQNEMGDSWLPTTYIRELLRKYKRKGRKKKIGKEWEAY